MTSQSIERNPEQSSQAGGKLPWVNPTIVTFVARDAEVFANPYGGVDAGIYSS